MRHPRRQAATTGLAAPRVTGRTSKARPSLAPSLDTSASWGYEARAHSNADSGVATAPDSAGRSRRVEPHRRGGVEPVPRPAFQDRCDNHQPADGCRQTHRLWPSELLQQVQKVRPGVLSQSNILRRQGDVQWLRNVEARRRIMHSISSHQPCCLWVWTVPESLPIQQTGVVRASDFVLVRHQRATLRKALIWLDDALGFGKCATSWKWW